LRLADGTGDPAATAYDQHGFVFQGSHLFLSFDGTD